MGGGAGAQRLEIVAAFEGGNDPALAMARCGSDESLGDPRVIGLDQHELREGLALREVQGATVQYHPEAGPGPHDALYLFDRFVAEIRDAA